MRMFRTWLRDHGIEVLRQQVVGEGLYRMVVRLPTGNKQDLLFREGRDATAALCSQLERALQGEGQNSVPSAEKRSTPQ
jgi:hypothetical protein